MLVRTSFQKDFNYTQTRYGLLFCESLDKGKNLDLKQPILYKSSFENRIEFNTLCWNERTYGSLATLNDRRYTSKD